MFFSLRLLRSQDLGQHATYVPPQCTSMQPPHQPGMRVAECSVFRPSGLSRGGDDKARGRLSRSMKATMMTRTDWAGVSDGLRMLSMRSG